MPRYVTYRYNNLTICRNTLYSVTIGYFTSSADTLTLLYLTRNYKLTLDFLTSPEIFLLYLTICYVTLLNLLISYAMLYYLSSNGT